MALLIVDLDKYIGTAAAWRDTFAARLPDLEIRIWPDAGQSADIEYLAFMHPDFDSLPVFPNLKAMFSRSAGVGSFYEGNRGHLLRSHLCHDATRGHAGECRPRQACGRRGPIKALDSGQLSYAALDALWPEPLPSGKPSG